MDYPFWPCLLDTQSEVRAHPLHILPINSVGSSSYISEAAASLLDRRLDLYIVPPTYLVSLSSPVSTFLFPCGRLAYPFLSQAFFYDWLDRNAVKKGKALPEKIGSMQYFLNGYTGMF